MITFSRPCHNRRTGCVQGYRVRFERKTVEPLRVCKRCFRRKPISDFGHSASGVRYYCKKCDSAYSRQYNETHRDWRAQCEKKYTKDDPRRRWATACPAGHRRRGFTTETSARDLYSLANKTDSCFIRGRKLDWQLLSKGRIKKDSPSLDRLDNGKVMRVDNAAILCYSCNASKRDRTLQKFVAYCAAIEERFHSHFEYPQAPHL